MKTQRFENEICKIDADLFKKDEYCFFVLTRIIRGDCRLTLTDKENFVICHSADPYPVWIWLPDGASEELQEFVYQTVKENFAIEKYRFNTKYFFAEYMIRRSNEDKIPLKIAQNLFSYRCFQAIAPKKPADGHFTVAKEEDLSAIVELSERFHDDVGIDRSSRDNYRKKAEAMIKEKQFFLWIDGQGEIVSTCSYNVLEDKACVGQVYTRDDKRRRGYAANLVYQTTLCILKQGLIPILYTDANYAASNACYEGVGYQKQGELCTVSVETRQRTDSK